MAMRMKWLSLVAAAVLALSERALADQCSSCHAPVGAVATNAPEWNRVAQPGTYALAVPVTGMCMTCHDGTSARSMLHEDMHPVDVDYDRLQTMERSHLRPSASPSGLGATIADDLLVYGRVACTSCHDPHASHGTGSGRLRVDNEGSRLCLTCHDR